MVHHKMTSKKRNDIVKKVGHTILIKMILF